MNKKKEKPKVDDVDRLKRIVEELASVVAELEYRVGCLETGTSMIDDYKEL